MSKRALWLTVVMLFTCVTLEAVANEVTVFRLQVRAFKQLAPAEIAAEKVRYASPDISPVFVRELSGGYPYKIWIGAFSSYAEAKAFEKTHEAEFGSAFVVSERIDEVQSESLGLVRPDSLHKQLLKEHKFSTDLDKDELTRRALASMELEQSMNPTDRLATLKAGLPYLLELAEKYSGSSNDEWVQQHLGEYYNLEFLRAREAAMPSSPKRASATESAALEAASERFKIITDLYPDSPFDATATYYSARLETDRHRIELYDASLKRGLAAFEEFRKEYPHHILAKKALFDIGEIKLGLAKKKHLPYEEAYVALEKVLAVTEPMTQFEYDKTRMMMGEIQQFYLHDSGKALEVLEAVDLGASQDRKIGANVAYIKAQAYRNLGRYEKAVQAFGMLVDEFDNRDFSYELDVHPICLYEMGECLMKQGNWDEAYEVFTRLKRDWPEDVRAVNYDKMLEWIENERSSEHE